MTYLIVGLGNPGKEYEQTRHNLGFLVVDELVKKFEAVRSNTKAPAELWTAKRGADTVLLAKPRTFMNLSGNAVGPIVKTKKIALSRLIIVHDDIDLPFGDTPRVSKGASAGGHNGVQSVIDALGSKDFTRVRIGIGRATNIPPEKYVLSRFTRDEEERLSDIILKARILVDALLQ